MGKIAFEDNGSRIVVGDCLDALREMESDSIHCCVTSPPYWGLRNYGHDDQFGLEKTPEEYVENMVNVFREVNRVLRPDGTLWLNLGDSYATGAGGARSPGGGKQGQRFKMSGMMTTQPNRMPIEGLKPKDLVGIPWRVAFALQKSGWYLRQDIIWSKPNPMPESVLDRCTKAHEYIFLLSKSERYFYDNEAIKEKASGLSGGASFGKQSVSVDGTKSQSRRYERPEYETRNKRSVWEVTLKAFKGAHFATYPPELIKPCILAGCPEGGIVLDPFFGSGTTGAVAREAGRRFIGVELNPDYVDLALSRFNQALLF